jgi:tripartite-type tricarboxylate transporter receptor subunit TctC
MKKLICAVLMIAASLANAQDYPAKPIRILVPFSGSR